MTNYVRRHSESAYLADSARLGDVIGAIQILGSFPFHAIRFEHWGTHFGTPLSSHDGQWDPIFKAHPEFFRIEKTTDVALKWRSAFERTYDPRTNIDYTPEQRDAKLTPEQKDKLHRRPLSTDQISALMNIAIELHARALAQAQDVRWKLQMLSGFAGGLIGAALGFAGAVIAAWIKH